MSQQLVDSLNQQVEAHLHGPGREEVLQRLEQDPSADTIAQVTYDLIMAMDSQANQRGTPLDLDVLMGVATETIDILVEIVQAMGSKAKPDELREESLLKIVLLHMKAVEGDPEQTAAAQEMLAALTEDGTMQQSMDYINNRASASPEQMQQAGQRLGQQMGPQRKPVSAAVQQGLMGGMT